MHWGFVILLVVVVTSVVASAGVMFYLFEMYHRSHRRKAIGPGDPYMVGKRRYVVPSLPMQPKRVRIMTEEYMLQQRELFVKFSEALETFGVKAWISDGTLLGFLRHKTFIPWDDDIDLKTLIQNESIVMSAEFQEHCAKQGIQLYRKNMRWFSQRRDGRTVAILHAFLKNQRTGPHLDLFYVVSEGNKVSRVRRIHGPNRYTLSQEPHEFQHSKQTIFPLHTRTVDGMKMNFPNMPEKLIELQYGKTGMSSMVGPSSFLDTHVSYFLKRFLGYYIDLN